MTRTGLLVCAGADRQPRRQTGAANRRYFFERGEQESMRSRRYDTPLSIALNHFKRIKDATAMPRETPCSYCWASASGN